MFALPYDINEKLPGWYAVEALCIALAVVFLIRASRAKAAGGPPSVPKINRGFAVFFIALMITRVLFTFSDYERLANDKTPLYATYVLFGYLSSLVGIALLAYLVDTFMLESKRKTLTWIVILITIGNAGVIVVTVATQSTPLLEVARWVVYGSTGMVFIIVILIYGGLARQSTGSLRRNAILSLLGVGIAVLGTLLDSDYLAQAGLVPIYFPPIIMLVGLVIFALGQREV